MDTIFYVFMYLICFVALFAAVLDVILKVRLIKDEKTMKVSFEREIQVKNNKDKKLKENE